MYSLMCKECEFCGERTIKNVRDKKMKVFDCKNKKIKRALALEQMSKNIPAMDKIITGEWCCGFKFKHKDPKRKAFDKNGKKNEFGGYYQGNTEEGNYAEVLTDLGHAEAIPWHTKEWNGIQITLDGETVAVLRVFEKNEEIGKDARAIVAVYPVDADVDDIPVVIEV